MELSKDQADQLALDEAIGFFNDDQLIVRHGLTIRQLEHIRTQDAFKALVLEAKRVLEDGGESFVHRARIMAVRALGVLEETLDSVEATRTQKLKASNDIIEIAGLKKKAPEGGEGGIRLTIHTNLALGGSDSKGVYAIEAKPTHPAATALIGRAVRAGEDLL